MKTSIFLTSFFSTNFRGSKPLTSPAMRADHCAASKRVIGPMPLVPAQSASQVCCVPMPTDETRPTPVTTTRLLKSPRLLLLGVALDVLDGFLHAGDLLGVLVWNFDAEFLFEGHDELDRVERVGAQVIDERRVRRHFFFIHTQLLDDDLLHLIRDRHHSSNFDPGASPQTPARYMYMPPL